MIYPNLMKWYFQLKSINDIPLLVDLLIKNSQKRKIWLFEGEMGSGKTTIIKSICKRLGVKDVVNSPTFSIVNEYMCKNSKKIYHFDLFRLNDFCELEEIGYNEYLRSGYYCFIEWPSKLNVVTEEMFVVNLEIIDDNIRKISTN